MSLLLYLHVSAFLELESYLVWLGLLAVHLTGNDKASGMQQVNRCPIYIFFLPECEKTAKLV